MVSIERGIELKQSRISFFYNYVLITLVLVFLALVWVEFDLTFTLFPQSFSEFSKTSIVFLFVGLIAILLEEPAIRRVFLKYLITNNEIIKIDGILRKHRTIIPYQSIANVYVYKGIIGRILNFGDVSVVGFKNQINMKGIREPETFYRIINNKIAVMRGTLPKSVSVGDEEEGDDVKKEQRIMGKKPSILGIFGKRRTESAEAKESRIAEEEFETIEETGPAKKAKVSRKRRKRKATKKTKRPKEK